jgi:hypothetical protein
MAQPPQASEAERAIAIRDHLTPLIETASAAHAMNGTPSLLLPDRGIHHRLRAPTSRLLKLLTPLIHTTPHPAD